MKPVPRIHLQIQLHPAALAISKCLEATFTKSSLVRDGGAAAAGAAVTSRAMAAAGTMATAGAMAARMETTMEKRILAGCKGSICC